MNGFTLQDILLLAAIKEQDSSKDVKKKTKLVSQYLDIYIVLHKINDESTYRNKLEDTIFDTVLEIRNRSPLELADYLKTRLRNLPLNFEGLNTFGLGKASKTFVRYFLVRLTHHIELKSGKHSDITKYLEKLKSGRYMYEIEHNIPENYNKYEHHEDFSSIEEFNEYRNKIGALVLLLHSYNRSLKDKPYSAKLTHYLKDNLLAQSLHPLSYQNDPPFLGYINRSGLPFKPHAELKREDIAARQKLYRQIAEEVWSYDRLNVTESTHLESQQTIGTEPDDLPATLSKALNQKLLAERLKTNSTNIQRSRDRKSAHQFCEWTRKRDPLGIGWSYNLEKKLYFPRTDCSIGS